MENSFLVFPEEIRRAQCKRINTPFRNCIGQDGAVERLLDLMYQGFGNKYHLVQENVMFAGPPSTGKTTLVKMLAYALLTPAVFTDSNQVNGGISIGDKNISSGADTVIHLMLDAWAKTEMGPLRGVKAGAFAAYTAAPMLVFIDEIHGLKRKTADALLKATERDDGMLFGRDTVMDCKNVLWVGATTDWGKLPPAFRTRFMRIDLTPPTVDEVVQIVKLHYPLDEDTCRQIVFYGSLVPREALAFARSVQRYSDRMGITPKNSVVPCARREGIDEYGMRRQRLEILKTLKNASDGMNLRNLSVSIGCEGEELVKHWLPPLLFASPPLVSFDRPQYRLTGAGLAELKKRRL